MNIETSVTALNILAPILLSVIAGSATGIGGLIVVRFGDISNRNMGFLMGFAAGVMTYVTIDELIPVAHEFCTLDQKHMVSSGLLIGMIFAMLLGLVLN